MVKCDAVDKGRHTLLNVPLWVLWSWWGRAAWQRESPCESSFSSFLPKAAPVSSLYALAAHLARARKNQMTIQLLFFFQPPSNIQGECISIVTRATAHVVPTGKQTKCPHWCWRTRCANCIHETDDAHTPINIRAHTEPLTRHLPRSQPTASVPLLATGAALSRQVTSTGWPPLHSSLPWC